MRRKRGAATGDAVASSTDGVEAEAPGRPPSAEADIAAGLSFREAQTALELSLAELQAADLDVEQMAGLYQRASRYAERCEQLLRQVEQEVMQWDPEQPMEPLQPFSSGG